MLQQRPWEELSSLKNSAMIDWFMLLRLGTARISFQKVRCLEFLLNYRAESVVLLSLWSQWEPDRWREWLTVSENDYQHFSFFRSIFVAHFLFRSIRHAKISRLIFDIQDYDAVIESLSFPNVSFDYITCWATVQRISNGLTIMRRSHWTLLTESSLRGWGLEVGWWLGVTVKVARYLYLVPGSAGSGGLREKKAESANNGHPEIWATGGNKRRLES